MTKYRFDTHRISQIKRDVAKEAGITLSQAGFSVDAYSKIILKYIREYGAFYIPNVGLLHARKTSRIETQTNRSWNFMKIAFRPSRYLKEFVNNRGKFSENS
jgi:hypothetical protein